MTVHCGVLSAKLSDRAAVAVPEASAVENLSEVGDTDAAATLVGAAAMVAEAVALTGPLPSGVPVSEYVNVWGAVSPARQTVP